MVDRVDHKNMNEDVEFMRGVIPTAENMAIAFWKILEPRIAEGKLIAIRLAESENNSV